MHKIARFFSLVMVASMLCLATSCISDRKLVYLQGAEKEYALPQEIAQCFELVIQPDDQLAISVASKHQELLSPFNNNTLIGGGANNSYSSNTANIQSGVCYFQVDKQGNIEFPIFGTLSTKGKTCKQLAVEIQERLVSENYVNDAVVNIRLMSFKVTVLGGVRNPGTQTFTGERLTVLEAIGRAGDLLNSGRRDHVLVIREEDGKRVTYEMDLRDTKQVFDSPAYYLQQNDVVYVQPNTSERVKGSTGYTLLSVGATVVSMIVSIVSLIIALK